MPDDRSQPTVHCRIGSGGGPGVPDYYICSCGHRGPLAEFDAHSNTTDIAARNDERRAESRGMVIGVGLALAALIRTFDQPTMAASIARNFAYDLATYKQAPSQIARIFRESPIKSSLFLCVSFFFLGALAGKFFYDQRNSIGSSIVGGILLLICLVYWLI